MFNNIFVSIILLIILAVNSRGSDVISVEDKKNGEGIKNTAEQIYDPITYFPLNKGSYWIYEVELAWTEEGGDVKSKKINEWKMEVMDVLKKEGVEIVQIKGFPNKVSHNKLFGIPIDTFTLKEGKFLEKDSFEIIFEFPLQVKKVYGCPSDAADWMKESGSYCWIVENEMSYEITSSEGILFQGRVYQVLFRTMPDHMIYEFAPGLGIVSYQYSHHGTTSEVHVLLKDFHLE